MQQNFSEKLIKLENVISSSSMGDGLGLRHFLGFERAYPHLGNLAPTLHAISIDDLSSRNKSVLSMLLLAYRTIDIAAALDEFPELSVKFERTGTFGECAEVCFFLSFLRQRMMSNVCRLWDGSITGPIF
jgi:hypothetical protein